MKRSFPSGASPAFLPSKSRIVEAIYIHLCNNIPCHRTTTTNGKRRFDSRWKLIVKEYNNIRARLFNSALLQETNITLFCVNVRLWEKDKTRKETVATLLQGRNSPGDISSTKRIPESQPFPSNVQDEAPLMSFDEPDDRSGLATLNLRRRKNMPEDPQKASPTRKRKNSTSNSTQQKPTQQEPVLQSPIASPSPTFPPIVQPQQGPTSQAPLGFVTPPTSPLMYPFAMPGFSSPPFQMFCYPPQQLHQLPL